MDVDLPWLLLGLPVAFALGWIAARMDLRQWRREREDSPRAYFKGLNLLLNEQQDQAIDAFIEAVQHDPDTAELHFALGNLFRRRGEFERAVRVHEHLLGRADLKPAERERAQRALAQDYMKAGLFDRAEAAWQALEGTAFDGDAQRALLSLYERSHDWARAVAVARRLVAAGEPELAGRVAHYECELALLADAAGQPDEAEQALARARQAHPGAPRPWVLAGQRALRLGQPAQALQAWETLRLAQPAAFLLVATDYMTAAAQAGTLEQAGHALDEVLQKTPAVELLRALRQAEQAPAGSDGAAYVARLVAHLQAHPSLSAAQLLLEQPPGSLDSQAWTTLRQAVAHSARPLQRYRCTVCGFEAQHYYWQCPGCLSWDSYPTQRIDAQ